MNLTATTLTHQHARLEPLALHHFDDLSRFNADPDIWRYIPFQNMETPEGFRAWMERAASEPERGTGYAFAIIDIASNTAVGSTSLYDISHQDKHVEIGRTWLGRPYQRTALNTECKYLLLQYCFDTLGCIRVQLKTDARNLKSQAAIERIGAVREGVLRAHIVMPDGYLRDTVMYSVLAPEWPDVCHNLESRMASYAVD
jgi:RimJ/RimL family protein N-acetyltransferase